MWCVGTLTALWNVAAIPRFARISSIAPNRDTTAQRPTVIMSPESLKRAIIKKYYNNRSTMWGNHLPSFYSHLLGGRHCITSSFSWQRISCPKIMCQAKL